MNIPEKITLTIDFSDDGKELIKELIKKIEKNEQTMREAIVKDEVNRLREELAAHRSIMNSSRAVSAALNRASPLLDKRRNEEG